METTTLFIPIGYGKGTIIDDLDHQYWIVGDVKTAPIHEVSKIDKEVAERLIKQGAKLLVSK